MNTSILIVDDEIDFLDSLSRVLKIAGYKNVRCDQDPRKTVASLEKGGVFDIAILDITMPHIKGNQLLEMIKDKSPNTECIMLTGLSDARTATECIKNGAYAYLVKPVHGDDILNIMSRAMERRRFLEILNLNKTKVLPNINDKVAFEKFRTRSERIVRLMKEAEIYAQSNIAVLISGEKGTGKKLLAESIHRASQRAAFPFIVVDAASFEGELTILVSGSTAEVQVGGASHASHAKPQKGSVLLDEVTDLSDGSQIQLLKLLQERQSQKHGRTDIRFLFSTKYDQKSIQDKELLRKDLFNYLSRSWINIPPLRERREDISLLINLFFEELKGWGQNAVIDEQAILQLLEYDYPQNVAELKEIIEYLVEKSDDRKIGIRDLPDRVRIFKGSVTFDPKVTIPRELVDTINKDYLLRELWCPYKVTDGWIRVLVDNPENLIKRDEIMRLLNTKSVEFLKSDKSDILRFIKHFYSAASGNNFNTIVEEAEDNNPEMIPSDEDEAVSESDSRVRRLVSTMISDAHNMRATDIHIEPDLHNHCVGIRFRIDGECNVYQSAPFKLKSAIVSRIKIMSDLDITERRLPQDGKIKFKLTDGSAIELRVAVLPTVGGMEDVTLRLLATNELVDLTTLGMPPYIQETFLRIISKPYGLILCVGPTGSGKTTTLHAALHKINKPGVKILTIEDPVEITQPGIRQLQVHRKIGLDFPMALRAFLRSDPDIMMIGEMRDHETAKIGIEASLTGHLVFSTLHTNNAPDTIVRLLDIGIDPYNFGDSLLGVLAQRLVRVLCNNCKMPYQPSQDELDKMDKACGKSYVSNILCDKQAQFYRATGCEKCSGTGYYGRKGIYELLVATDSIKKLIIRKESAELIREAAIREGMITLIQDGFAKVFEGVTNFEQVERVCMR
jgi:type II secretory ATPase GspE/PulE/Tfp pilus assembly ATPase PilB-like protein/DNA-binding NarL/FixJ family response regulator